MTIWLIETQEIYEKMYTLLQSRYYDAMFICS